MLCLAEAPPTTRRAGRPEQPPLEQPGRLAAAWTVLLGADVRLRVMAAIVLGLTVTGIAIFWWFSEQNLDLIDAIYFTVTIMTTTGFGDIHLRNAPPLLQLDDGHGPRWRPDGRTPLDGGAELVAVVPRGELGRVLAWTDTAAPAPHN